MRILILGGNGMIGHKMYQTLSVQYSDTWILLRQKYGGHEYDQMFDPGKVVDQVDISDYKVLLKVLDEVRPDIIVNAAGITIRRGVDKSVCTSIIVNAALPHFLEEWAASRNSTRLIHFSTDCVFSGRKGSYSEDSELDAQDIYGRTKGMGEVSGPCSLTLRGSMIGRELDYHTELLEWFLSQKKGSTVKGFSSVIYSGITTVKMGVFVKQIIEKMPSLSGVYNVSSKPISKYHLLELFNETFEREIEIIEDRSYASRKDLLSDRFYKDTGFKMPDWHELAIELKKDALNNKKYYKNYE